MILSSSAERLKRRSKDDFKGRHFEASLIVQAVSWYLRYPLSYRDIEELFLERGLAVDHSTLNRWVLAYAPLIERRLRSFRKPHCGSIRIDETYIKIRGQWRYLYRAIDKHGTPVDFLLTAKRDLEAAKRFFPGERGAAHRVSRARRHLHAALCQGHDDYGQQHL
jgi:transposase, IS6 family